MPNQTPAVKVRPFHCMMPSANPADGPDPLSALRREMKLLLVEQDLMRIELNQRRAAEDELREANEVILAYVERVEQLSVMEAEARGNSGNEKRNAWLKRGRVIHDGVGTIFSASRAVWSHCAHIVEQGLAHPTTSLACQVGEKALKLE